MSIERQLKSAVSLVLRVFFIALALGVVLRPAYSVAQGMHLMAPGIGWASSGGALYWTTDNGKQWKNITPPVHGGIVSVFFLDSSAGWVLGSTMGVPADFEIAFTQDSGASWSVTKLDLPVKPKSWWLLGQGSIQFLDKDHGWMNLTVQSGAIYHLGVLFRTADGGKHWTQSNSPQSSGDIHFIDARNGWLLNSSPSELWVTHDAGSTWNEVSLKPPPQYLSDDPQYQLPAFSDSKHGAILVTFSAPLTAPDASDVVLFSTSDGGREWKFDRSLAHLSCRSCTNLEAVVTDSTLLTAQRLDEVLTMKSTAVTGQGSSTAQSANIGFSGALLSFTVANTQQAWVVTTTGNCAVGLLPCTQLLSTTDGGVAWSDITPGRPKATKPQPPSGKPIPLEWKPGGWKAPTTSPAPNGVSFHYGLDTCSTYSVPQMQALWQGAAFHDVGFYIGDFAAPIHRNCFQPTPGWVDDIINGSNQTWGVVPIWSAYQAPCAGYNATISLSPNVQTDYTLGTQMADAAHNAVQALGLGNAIVYLDLENYDQNNTTCANAASAYVSGWVTQLHNVYQQPAGVYGNPADAPSWPVPPDDVWFTLADFRVTIWGMAGHGLTGTDDSLWPNNQRGHQFMIKSSEVIGRTTYSIDRDIWAATIANINYPKFGTLNPSQIDYTGTTCETSLSGINNYGFLGGTLKAPSGYPAGALDYWFSGTDNWQTVNSASVMASINNLCYDSRCVWTLGGNNWSYGSNSWYPNIAVGTNATTICKGHGLINCGPPNGVVEVEGQGATNFTCTQGIYGTNLNGINDDMQYVGSFVDNNEISHGFVSPDTSGQNCNAFDPTGSAGTFAGGVNGDGQVVGTFRDAEGAFHGYIYPYGALPLQPPTQIDWAGATGTQILGINNNGLMLIWANLSSGGTYILNDENSGNYAEIPVPTTNALAGLNDNSQIVGWNQSNQCVDGLVLNSNLIP